MSDDKPKPGSERLGPDAKTIIGLMLAAPRLGDSFAPDYPAV